MRELGQTVIIDFALGFFVFLIAFGALTIFWNQNINEKTSQTMLVEMENKANLAAESLVKGPGSPANWEELNIADANSIGLAIHPHSIDEQKLNTFKNTDYTTAKKLLNVSEYDFFFEFFGDNNVTAGLPTGADIDRITIQRTAEYKGSEAIARLTLYRT